MADRGFFLLQRSKTDVVGNYWYCVWCIFYFFGKKLAGFNHSHHPGTISGRQKTTFPAQESMILRVFMSEMNPYKQP